MTARGLPKIIIVLASVMVVDAMLYWIVGVPRALDVVEQVFGTTHPRLPDGSIAIPPIESTRVIVSS